MNKLYRNIGLAALALSVHSTGVLAEEFLLGEQEPLTGALARVGTGMHEGIALAVEVFNQTNGKQTIKVVPQDDESSPAKAIAAVETLASQDVLAFPGG